MSKGFVGGEKIGYLRGREIRENIPEDWIQKAKNILEDENSNITIIG